MAIALFEGAEGPEGVAFDFLYREDDATLRGFLAAQGVIFDDPEADTLTDV